MNEDTLKPISVLSGGEKVRLVLLLLMLSNPDLLILDEPTNHLDIETKDIIEDVFDEFSGPIIFVSHDRYFINKIGTKIIHLSNSDVTEFDGSYEEFKELKREKVIKKQKTKREKITTINYEKEIKSLEKEIHKVETKIKKLEDETFKSEIYTNHLKIKNINDKIDALKDELIILEEKYYELHEL